MQNLSRGETKFKFWSFSVIDSFTFQNQMENLPLEGIFKYTAAEGTDDCEDDPAYNRDEVNMAC